MITKKDYTEFKPYWDYQRKIEYNRELLEDRVELIKIELQTHEGVDLPLDEKFNEMWNALEPEDYEDPPRAWIPKNADYQVEGEAQGSLPDSLL